MPHMRGNKYCWFIKMVWTQAGGGFPRHLQFVVSLQSPGQIWFLPDSSVNKWPHACLF